MKKFFRNKVMYLFNPEIMALLLIDCFLLPLALFTAVWLRLGAEWDPRLNEHIWLFFCLPLWTIPIWIKLGLYRAIIRFVDDKIVYIVFVGVSISILILVSLIVFTNAYAFPRSSIGIYWLFALVYVGGTRFILRSWLRRNMVTDSTKRVAIYGAGVAGVQLLTYLTNGNEFSPLFFIDDDSNKWNKTIRGIKVYSPDDLIRFSQNYKIEQVLLAIPSAPLARRREIITNLEKNSIYVKTLPKLDGLITGKVHFSDISDVDIEDLLGRLPVVANQELLAKNIVGKSVLVTGAGGSIGSELCRQIADLRPETLVIFDSSEFALYTIEQELRERFSYVRLRVVLGSVTNASLIASILRKYHIQTIYHAAAYKHVPMVEHSPLSGIKNNAIGTYVVAQEALKAKVSNVVLISTDKAVRPTNVMGTTKRLAELILQAFAAGSTSTIFNMVRFGNVLGSSGSVVPLFKKQIKAGGPITVTHPDIIRYFMTIPEAVDLVIQAGSMAHGGEVFVLDMGEPVKITDLARKMIYLSGLTVKDENNPSGDIEIKYTGLRPGEKLYEELLIGDNPAP
ncbi:MAG: polysaccharide biosynthesis protein, partial [Proteobacteria bacterium]